MNQLLFLLKRHSVSLPSVVGCKYIGLGQLRFDLPEIKKQGVTGGTKNGAKNRKIKAKAAHEKLMKERADEL